MLHLRVMSRQESARTLIRKPRQRERSLTSFTHLMAKERIADLHVGRRRLSAASLMATGQSVVEGPRRLPTTGVAQSHPARHSGPLHRRPPPQELLGWVRRSVTSGGASPVRAPRGGRS
jgi:hypothetical protein